MESRVFPIRLIMTLLLAATFAVVGAGHSRAQDVTDDGTPPAGAEVSPEATVDLGRPVHIHAGNCIELGEVVAPLTDLRAVEEEGVAETEGDGVEDESDVSNAGIDDIAEGLIGPIPVETSFTTVDLALDELVDGDYAINAHLSAENIDTYIACGDIGGARTPDGAVVIGLREVEDSRFAGIAYLAPNAANPGQTDVSVFLAENLTGEGPTGGLAGPDDEEVEESDADAADDA